MWSLSSIFMPAGWTGRENTSLRRSCYWVSNMLTKSVYATICGIPNRRGLFLEPSVLLHLTWSLLVLWMPETFSLMMMGTKVLVNLVDS